MSDDTVIEISNVWKIFGDRPEVALKAIRDEGLSKAQVLERFNAVVGVADVSYRCDGPWNARAAKVPQ